MALVQVLMEDETYFSVTQTESLTQVIDHLLIMPDNVA